MTPEPRWHCGQGFAPLCTVSHVVSPHGSTHGPTTPPTTPPHAVPKARAGHAHDSHTTHNKLQCKLPSTSRPSPPASHRTRSPGMPVESKSMRHRAQTPSPTLHRHHGPNSQRGCGSPRTQKRPPTPPCDAALLRFLGRPWSPRLHGALLVNRAGYVALTTSRGSHARRTRRRWSRGRGGLQGWRRSSARRRS